MDLSTKHICLWLCVLAALVAIYALYRVRELVLHPLASFFFVLAVILLPASAIVSGISYSLERTKQAEFCVSCHDMDAYGKSLLVDDNEFVPALHYQKRLIPRETACYTCHKDYAMFGEFKTKLNGLKHVYAHYFSRNDKPIKLYKPYSNQNCLGCHEGARGYEESSHHEGKTVSRAALKAGKISCVSSGCHDVVHNVAELKDAEFWKGANNLVR